MKKFTCVSIGFSSTRVVERNAKNSDDAAEAHAKALHKAYWADAHRTGQDSHGAYCEYAVKETTSRVHSVVRVYGGLDKWQVNTNKIWGQLCV